LSPEHGRSLSAIRIREKPRKARAALSHRLFFRALYTTQYRRAFIPVQV
jgi:hypothetical protein